MHARTAASKTSCSVTAPHPGNPPRLRRRSRAMPSYTPPIRDMQFVMHEELKVTDDYKAMPRYADTDVDTINAFLEEGGKFASEVTFPLNRGGDEQGCTHDAKTHEVTTPMDFKEAYHQYVEGGWPALSCDPQYGGQGLPIVVNQAFYEMLNSANQAWTMYPGLTHGAYECLHAHGTPEQQQMYLPKLTSGEWTGTMCLTEPHCGTDLGMLRTKAEPQADGTYRITGNKIFISAGEHDFVSNIVHLVLARLPDAPKGSKGISLFVVPKFNVNKDGTLGARNGIYCTGLEHKLGIHGNAPAQLALDGAVGTLVGDPNKGLQAMFVMMNAARIGVGMQSLGLTEVAYQNALAYAKERLQSRSLSGPKAKDQPADPIIVHPDVRKMILTAKAYAEGGRALSMYCAFLIDKELHRPDEKVRKDSEERVNEKMAEFINPIAYLGDHMSKFTTEIGFKAFQNPDEVGAAAVDYLRVAGHLVFGYFWARMAQVALREIAAGNTDPFYGAKLQTARFYFAKLFPETATLMRTARAGLKPLADTDLALA